MDYTAKTIILDMAVNYGSLSVTGIRSIDFYFNGSKIAVLAADITCYATNNYAAFPPSAVFDTSLSKIGAGDYTSCLNSSYPSRIICVFNTEITFNEVRINNYHSTGGTTGYGAKDVKIIISDDVTTDTVYGNTVSNSTIIFDGVFDRHPYTDTEEEQILTLGIPAREYSFTGTAGALVGGQGVVSSEAVPPPVIEKSDYTARSVVFDIANTWGSTYSGIRSIDFWLDGVKISNNSTLSTIYATGYISNYLPIYAFDTSLSKVNGADYNALQYAGVLRRIICVFNSLTVFDEIRINNYVDWGINTDRGLKDVVITVSTDIITNTTPNATISNAVIAFDGTFDRHITNSDVINGNVEDEQILVLNTLEPIFTGLGGAVAGGQGIIVSRNTAAFITGSGGVVVGGNTVVRTTLRASVIGSGGAVISGNALKETSLVITGNYNQPFPEIYGKLVNGYILNGNYNQKVPTISGTLLNTVMMTGQFYHPRISIFGTTIESETTTDFIGNFNSPMISIDAEAIITIIANGNVSIKKPTISAEMSSEGFFIGNMVIKKPTITAKMFAINSLTGDFNIKHPEIAGIVINSIVAYGNYNSPMHKVQAVCENPEDATIIKYRRDKCAYA